MCANQHRSFVCCVCLAAGGCALSVLFYATIIHSLYKLPSIKRPINPDSARQRIIVDWTGFFGGNLTHSWQQLQSNCKWHSNCLFTRNRSLVHLADAVLFHQRDIDWTDLPPKRYPIQRYIFYMQESPEHTENLDELSKHGGQFFNWTMTYRSDSDLPVPYSHRYHLRPTQPTALKDLPKILATKNKTVIWFASNCQTASQRELYVDELRKHIAVDIYGACGKLRCAKDNLAQSKCYEMMQRDYKFFIAFENSVCMDYLTEKITRMHSYWTVPIALNTQVMQHYNLPPHSHIVADQFVSPKALAKYLLYLHHNQTAYREYFVWRERWSVGASPQSTFQSSDWCTLCHLLHTNQPLKTYPDIRLWWAPPNICRHKFASQLLQTRTKPWAEPDLQFKDPTYPLTLGS